MKASEKTARKANPDIEGAIRALFEQALAGDEAAYRLFLHQVAIVLRAFLFRAMRPDQRSAEKVEDLVQEVLLTVHNKRDLYQAGMPVLPWIRVIAKHRLIDSIRADIRRPDLVELSEELEKNFYVTETESSIDVEALMAGLSDKQREILTLAKVEGVPHAEIAKRLGISLSLVKVTIHRSLANLRKNFHAKK